DLERVPGGSSGGSAASVAAFENIFSLGSDTGGSIRQPASYCGVAGLKPTYGAVSRYGLVAFASSLDQIGPLTRSIEDMAIVANTLYGHDSYDSTSLNYKFEDFTKDLDGNVKGVKIGLPKEYFSEGIDKDVKEQILNAAKTYEKMGAELVEISLSLSDFALPTYYILSSAEASSNLARFDGVKYGYRTENFTNLNELYVKTRSEGFGDEVKRRILLGTYVLSSGYYDAYYKKALQARKMIKNNFEEAFKKVDVILTPATPETAFKMGEKTDDPLKMYMSDICTVAINIAGIPALVTPCGKDSKGLPIGMQLIGKERQDGFLMKVADAYDKNTGMLKAMAAKL
ncbi:MAG: Asp-tRNA(Asn)/Glu-tRNA(Gln) amidotransferase subunit GatA, partial [Ruminococcaceae bacterium]|nr:Asp-tRNA(Asn)/Glu-tRNA(Gln) amidotransferase subunit GatA [Oscillospiraceae bacterium]